MGKKWKERGSDQGEKETEGQLCQGRRVTEASWTLPLVLPIRANFTSGADGRRSRLLIQYSEVTTREALKKSSFSHLNVPKDIVCSKEGSL